MAEVNKEELRRLAEACVCGDWFKSGDLRHFDDKTGDAHGLNAEDDLLISAADPRRILSLLDENAAQAARIAELERECERLRNTNQRIANRLCACRDCGGKGEIYSGRSIYQGHFQPPEPEMDKCGTCDGDGVLGPLEDFEALAAELEACRKDAERYRWLLDNSEFIHWENMLRADFEDVASIGQFIDAAMQEGGV